MFETLTDKLLAVFKKLSGKGKLSEEDIALALREVRMALLEADVHLQVVKEFVAAVRQKAFTSQVFESLTPHQQIIDIVHQQLIESLGGGEKELMLSQEKPSVIFVVGLQGTGKTTTCAKLALYFKKKGLKVSLASTDFRRPGAQKQLHVLSEKIHVPAYVLENGEALLGDSLVSFANNVIRTSQSQNDDVLIVDTQGRLHVDDELMQELQLLSGALVPQHVLFTADSMTGQDAVVQALSFNSYLTLTGIILTKCDGDARGGAALSIKSVTGCPILFMGTGEKVEALEPFSASRLASQILGMGDVIGLIEKTKNLSEEKVKSLEKKMKQGDFSLEDFLDQMQEMRKMGPLSQLLDMVPGISQLRKKHGVDVDEKDFGKIEAILSSMTAYERRNPKEINGSRKRRIAVGSGTSIQAVNQLLKQFTEMRKMMKLFSSGGFKTAYKQLF